MIRTALFAAAFVAGLFTCAPAAAAALPSASPPAARLVNDQPSGLRARSGSSGLAGGARRPHARATNARSAELGRAAVEAARASAVEEPAAESYVGAEEVYAWAEGGLYRLYTAPGEVSDIALQPGERLISVAAGDTARWVIGDTASGSGARQRTHVLVKPSAPGLRTNLVIATDRRVYHVELQSSAKHAMTAIAWTYPGDGLLALAGPAPAPDDPVASGVSLDALNFDYRIEGGDPTWRPLRAFDDGRQVFIEFPPTLAKGDAPPLFVTGEKGRPELVNYRVRGRFYVVDHLFEAAELRLGTRHQQVVRIVREHPPGARRGS